MKFFLQISVLLISWQLKCQGMQYSKFEKPDCPVNMRTFRESLDSTDLFCDCYDTYLYFPATDSCHMAYTQGPCSPGNYLVLSSGETVAKCEKNPCSEDGLIPFEGSCARFNEPCGMNGTYQMRFIIDKDFQIHCGQTGIYGYGIIVAPVRECTPGSRRTSTGKCKTILKK